MSRIVEIEYSHTQANAWLDYCLYRIPYGGLEIGEEEYLKEEAAKLGITKYRYVKQDDANIMHIIETDE